MKANLKTILQTLKAIAAILGFVASVWLINLFSASYTVYDPKEIPCPTATDLVGHTMPSYERINKKGIYIIKHCDGTIILDTVK